MNIESKIFDRLSNKVELESQKVELGIIEDSRASLDKASQFLDIQSEIIAVENKLKKALPIYEEVVKTTNDGIAKLKDLGVDGGLIASLQKQNSEAAQGIKSVNSMVSYLSKAI